MPRSLLPPILSLLLLLMACDHLREEEGSATFRCWEQITASDTLRIGTLTSPQDFYLYRGEMMGQEYRKVLDFAKAHQLELEVRIERSSDSLLVLLEEGQIDLCITPQPLTRTNMERYAFAGMIDTATLVLVQKRREPMVTNLSELSGKEVWTDDGSASHIRIEQIEEEIGADIHIMVPDTLSIEELLVLMPSSDSIDYALADSHLGQLVARYFPMLDASLTVSAPIKYGWVVAQNNETIKEQLDAFFLTTERKQHYRQLASRSSHLSKYISDRANRVREVHLTHGAVSPYDDIFRREAHRLPWHWTLLAAIAYQESRFTSDVVGWSGARGLMGIMPSTGRSFGANKEQLLLPDVSVRVAVDCLLEVRKSFLQIHNPRQQLCFTLASYNAGLGHIQDAMRLASKHNAPDTLWAGGVREYVLLKSNTEYYNDPVVRFGYLRGKETVSYVDDVVERSELYRKLLDKK